MQGKLIPVGVATSTCDACVRHWWLLPFNCQGIKLWCKVSLWWLLAIAATAAASGSCSLPQCRLCWWPHEHIYYICQHNYVHTLTTELMRSIKSSAGESLRQVQRSCRQVEPLKQSRTPTATANGRPFMWYVVKGNAHALPNASFTGDRRESTPPINHLVNPINATTGFSSEYHRATDTVLSSVNCVKCRASRTKHAQLPRRDYGCRKNGQINARRLTVSKRIVYPNYRARLTDWTRGVCIADTTRISVVYSYSSMRHTKTQNC